MLSPVLNATQYEIWLHRPDGVSEPCESCGLFGESEHARRVATAIRIWFHESVWCGAVLDALPTEAQDELFALRRDLVAAGLETARVNVQVHRYCPTVNSWGSTGEEVQWPRLAQIDI